MKAFIEISKNVRAMYKRELPFVAGLCKLPQREDVKLNIERYLIFKSDYLNQAGKND